MPKLLNTLPIKDNFTMLAEFQKHRASYFIFPHRLDTWYLGAYPARLSFKKLVETIATFEPVTVFCQDDDFLHAKNFLADNIRVITLQSDDSWLRDTAPIFIANKNEMRAVIFSFNAYGGEQQGSYYPWHHDDLLAEKWLHIEDIDYYKNDFVLEGGAISTDGQGTLIAIKSCVLNPNRNTNMTEAEAEVIFKNYLGIDKVIWLDEGLLSDETGGHTDNFCIFTNLGEVALHWCEDSSNPQYQICKQALEILENTLDAKKRKLKIHKIRSPKILTYEVEELASLERKYQSLDLQVGEKLACTHLNCYIGNNFVILPIFESIKNNQDIIKQFQDIFNGRAIIPFYSKNFLLGGGNVHCLSKDLPDFK